MCNKYGLGVILKAVPLRHKRLWTTYILHPEVSWGLRRLDGTLEKTKV